MKSIRTPGSVEGSKAPRGGGLALVLVPSAGVHRAKGGQSSLAEQVEVHLHQISRKEQHLKDWSARDWPANSVRR